jgi:hypothetical protein
VRTAHWQRASNLQYVKKSLEGWVKKSVLLCLVFFLSERKWPLAEISTTKTCSERTTNNDEEFFSHSTT